jgi:WD40 repeat protein
MLAIGIFNHLHTNCHDCVSLPLAATGSVDSKVSIWDIQTHRVRHTLLHEVGII